MFPTIFQIFDKIWNFQKIYWKARNTHLSVEFVHQVDVFARGEQIGFDNLVARRSAVVGRGLTTSATIGVEGTGSGERADVAAGHGRVAGSVPIRLLPGKFIVVTEMGQQIKIRKKLEWYQLSQKHQRFLNPQEKFKKCKSLIGFYPPVLWKNC